MRILVFLCLTLHCCWATDPPVPEEAVSYGESCTADIRTPDSYVYVPVVIPADIRMNTLTSISFAVKTCNDAHIALSTSISTSDLDKGVGMYEIVIGGWSNTQSVIRKAKQGTNLAVKSSHNPVNCREFRRFYVRWDNGVIEVGAQMEDADNPGSYTDQPSFMSYTDPSPPTINQVFVSGWRVQSGTWKIDFPCEEKSKPKSESCDDNIRTPDSYVYVPVVIPTGIRMNTLTSISFAVKICNDAHIALSTDTDTSDLNKGVNMYEIVIGGWSNTQSVIRKAKQGTNLAVKSSHNPVNCREFRRFYVRWHNGVIEVGAQMEDADNPGSYTDQPPFMSYTDPSPPTINQVFVSGWNSQSGTWKIDLPCKEKSCGVDMRTPDLYMYIPLVVPTYINVTEAKSVSFAVKICNDAHIALSNSTSTSDLNKGVGMYEIVIGGWSNTQSVIRKAKQGPNLAVKRRYRPLNCNQFRRFYVRWDNGTIAVGARTKDTNNPGFYTDQPPFMNYTDPSPPTINQVFFSGWGCQDGRWRVEFPCNGNN